MKRNHARWLVVVGLVLMVISIVDPLEGSVVALGGSILVAVGASGSRTQSRLPFTAVCRPCSIDTRVFLGKVANPDWRADAKGATFAAWHPTCIVKA